MRGVGLRAELAAFSPQVMSVLPIGRCRIGYWFFDDRMEKNRQLLTYATFLAL